MNVLGDGFGTSTDEAGWTDEELTALALAADPDQVPDVDAVPFRGTAQAEDGLLPLWYMPPPQPVGRSRRRVAIVAIVILALIVINALGLCITYGRLELA